MNKSKILKIALLFILFFNLTYLYRSTYCFSSDKISMKEQGSTGATYITFYGDKKIERKLIEKGYTLDSITSYEFNTSGKDIDCPMKYWYDTYLIEFEIDTIEENVNNDKKYCAVLKIISSEHVNKYFYLLNILCLWIVVLIISIIFLKKIFLYIKKRNEN